MKKIAAVIFLALVLFTVTPFISYAAIPPGDLDSLLLELGLTKEEFNDYLLYYFDEELQTFNSIDELNETVGTRLNETTILPILDSYGFETIEDAEAFLTEYGEISEEDDVFTTFLFTNALEDTLAFYDEVEMDVEDFGLEELGLTSDEVLAVFEHLMSLDIDSAEFESKLLGFESRLNALGEFESAEELTQAQLEELYAIMEEMLSLFHLQADYYLIDENGTTTGPLSKEEMISMTSTNGKDLLIEIYDLEGNYLADLIFTADMFGSDWIQEQTKTIASPETVKKATVPLKTTVKGAKLPKTAGFYTEKMFLGLGLIIVGFVIFRRRSIISSK
ncbi:processed acidic surface protein [Bacillus salacetis]|uniref:Processed acidic surface protein n=1 Tax=Bacillus salacetis TaxID=2315464 RepID=A0A3A1QUK3_9BACI|nr:processed acidic surface protein [Bacillus salacetis]RIW31827.1 processed acidic surface protein [Bacillus salacetis]